MGTRNLTLTDPRFRGTAAWGINLSPQGAGRFDSLLTIRTVDSLVHKAILVYQGTLVFCHLKRVAELSIHYDTRRWACFRQLGSIRVLKLFRKDAEIGRERNMLCQIKQTDKAMSRGHMLIAN